MDNFDWFSKQVSLVPRTKFFRFKSCSPRELKEFENSFGPLPTDYVNFVTRFGRADLFLHPKTPLYYLKVIAPPEVFQEPNADDGISVQVGHFINAGGAFYKSKNHILADDGAIFTGQFGPSRKSAATFTDWFRKAFHRSRRLYNKREWEEILRPSAPFTPQEEQIVQALPLFAFRKIGVSSAGNVLVEISNNSAMQLPYLTVGVKLPKRGKGGYALPISGVRPGETKIIECPIYQSVADPADVELFRKPSPEPEDRPYFLELKPLDDKFLRHKRFQ